MRKYAHSTGTGQCIHTITRAAVTMVCVTTSAPGAAWAREEWREFRNLMSCCWRCREVSGDQANVWIYQLLSIISIIYAAGAGSNTFLTHFTPRINHNGWSECSDVSARFSGKLALKNGLTKRSVQTVDSSGQGDRQPDPIPIYCSSGLMSDPWSFRGQH